MALTAKERETELEEADEAPPPPAEIGNGEEEEEEDDGKTYNPKGYPLGWGRGNRFLLGCGKLHGLGMTFDCEICSEATFQGESPAFMTAAQHVSS